MAPSIITCPILAGCFAVLLILDQSLTAALVYPAWYWVLRRNASVIVILGLSGLWLEIAASAIRS